MNRKIKKLAAAFLTMVMLLAAMPGQLLVSYAATGKITFSDPSVTVGNQVSVNMKITSSSGEPLGASDVMLEYDSSALEFVSGTNANGGAGSIRVVGAMESAEQTTFSFTLKFKALKAGTSSIKVRSQEVYDANSQAVTIEHVGNSAVKVNAPETYSREASLSSLTVSPGELSPAFSADVTEYTVTVPGDTEKITVSAPAKDDKAKVVVEGNEYLESGENTVVCKVTAEDGTTTKTYTITVVKSDEVPSESNMESDSTEAAAPGVAADSGNWQVAETFNEEELPDGFTVTEYEYNGTQVQAAVNEQGTILLYMTDEEGNGDFFIYDAVNGLLAPYVTVRMAEKTIIVLPPSEIPEGIGLPEGFVACTIDIGSHTVDGWIWKGSETPEYCVVYGRNADGEKNFYRYDQKEMTLQRYFPDPDAEDLRAKYVSVAEDYNGLLDDYRIRGYIIVGLFGVCILLVILLLILLLTRKPKNTYKSEREWYREPENMKQGRKTERGIPQNKRTIMEEEEPEPGDLDLEPEEEEPPVRKSAKNLPSGKRTPARSVADLERDIASSLAKEAGQAAKEVPPQADEDEDEDFEFIDLDL